MGHAHAHGPANRGRRVLRTAAPLFVREPGTGAYGGAVVLHDVFGVTEYAEGACRRLAREGWIAVSPYLYHERGGPAYEPAEPAERERARGELARLSPEDLAADVEGALAYLTGRRGLRRAVVVGLEAGGYLATWAATRFPEVAAVAAVSPAGVGAAPWEGLPPLELLVPDRRAPWLAVAADGDPGTERLRPAAASAGPRAEVRVLPGTGPGFYREGAPEHDPAAATTCWDLVLAFLSEAERPPGGTADHDG
ncbi:dienelactone hydrolase family protein [Bailinhaonella thermotolerans]|uniref:Dienelactone hydrolase domain-containing protein n=1 Tax=Bailinhaonella thermotolerans TaxID=1070861 RepID=A0A3A4A694_9ACTN|nr:dienelactone hydrolase family protein [Bailinhaonella thermotolerans]RJL24426.1 hypothetical protein D5H75_29265 [Bailinhaonella thermotolerans]